MGHLSKVKHRREEQKVSGKQGEEIGVKGMVDDRERQNDSGRGMGALGEGLGTGLELQFVKFTDKSWFFQQSLSVMGSAR